MTREYNHNDKPTDILRSLNGNEQTKGLAEVLTHTYKLEFARIMSDVWKRYFEGYISIREAENFMYSLENSLKEQKDLIGELYEFDLDASTGKRKFHNHLGEHKCPKVKRVMNLPNSFSYAI